MRRFVLFYGFMAVALLALGAILWIQSGADKTVLEYQKTVAFSPREMTYADAVHPLVGEGVVLSRVHFPGIRSPHQVGRLLIRLTPSQIQLKMSAVRLEVAQALVQAYGDKLTDIFRAYQAPQDALTKPLETAALLGLDTVTGDVDITLEPRGETTALTARFSRNGRPVLDVSGTVYVPSTERGRLWGWTKGFIPDVTVRITDSDLLRSYMQYLKASEQPVPPALDTAVVRNEPLALHIELNPPIQPVGLLP